MHVIKGELSNTNKKITGIHGHEELIISESQFPRVTGKSFHNNKLDNPELINA